MLHASPTYLGADMVLKRLAIFATTAALATLGAGAPQAQTIGVIDSPAELPPASYGARQYVDSKGCVFVRAGFDDAVIWVPRVTRDRDQVCGYKPSLSGAGEAASAPQTVAAAPAAVSKPARTARVGAPIETVAPKPVARPAAPEVVKAPASKPPSAPPPKMVARIPAPRATPQPMRPAMTAAVRPAPSMTVRTAAPAPATKTRIDRATQLHGKRIVPRHVWEARDPQRPVVPEGYRAAWQDDRLNPYRAWQTVEGYYATQQRWTNKVPRRAVSRSRSHSVRDPILLLPAQRVTVSRPELAPGHRARTAKKVYVSTKSEPATRPRVSGAARYVEIGAFSSSAGAREAVARLTGAGLPVRTGTLERDGTALKRVVVGPYHSEADLGAALAAVRATGYVRAYLR